MGMSPSSSYSSAEVRSTHRAITSMVDESRKAEREIARTEEVERVYVAESSSVTSSESAYTVTEEADISS